MGTLLYKFKPIEEKYDKNQKSINYTLDTLESKQLWVPCLENLNDPQDFSFSLENPYCHCNPFWIADVQKVFFQERACLSFSKSFTSKRLWNYYTDGMKGIVLAYDADDIRKSLNCCGYFAPGYNNDQRIFYEGSVEYDGDYTDMTDYYKLCSGQTGLQFVSAESYFHKDDTWKDEDEYRFSFELPDGNTIGMLLDNLVPKEIIVGYRIETKYKKRVEDFCVANGVKLYVVFPDFAKKSMRFVKKTLYYPNVDKDNQSYYYSEFIPYT